MELAGVVTDRDIMMRAIAKNKDLSKTPVTEVMNKEIIYCDEDDILQRAVYLMSKYRLRRMSAVHFN